MVKKLRSLLIGATGVAGQQFVAALNNHPWFELTGVAASSRSAGKTYGEALKSSNGMVGWFVNEPLPPAISALKVVDSSQINPADYDVAFSAVESDVASELEPRLAKDIPVISAASAFRYDDDVPLLIPPVNAAHAPMIRTQQKKRGFKGFIVPIPNCTTTGLAITLAPLEKAFGVKSVVMTSMQAMSGAGRSPGVVGMDILDNVVPHIPKEEHKVEVETKKILGGYHSEVFRPHDVRVSCTCTRVAVMDGHTEAVFVGLGRKVRLDEVSAVLRDWQGDEISRALPSAPPRWIEVLEDPFRPQPRLDRDTHAGMATSVGRLREDGVLENGIKYVLVSHNTKMGAAKGAVLVAELLKAQGLLS